MLKLNVQTIGVTVGGSILFGLFVRIGWEIGGRLWAVLT